MRCLALACFFVIASYGQCNCLEVSMQQLVSCEDARSNAPLVVVNDTGDAVALWQSQEGQAASLKISFRSLNSDWSKPQTLRKTNKQIKEPQLVMNAHGEVALLWMETKGGHSELLTLFRLKNKEWTEPSSLLKAKDLFSPRIAMNDEGQVISVWEQGTLEESLVVSSTSRSGETWSEHCFLSSGGAHCPQVVINEQGQLRVIWEQNGAIVGISSFFGLGWTEVMPVSDPSQSALRPQLFMNRAGQAVAIWEKKLGYKVSLQAAYCKPGLGWTPPSELSNEEETVSEPTGVINDHGDALVVWRRSTIDGLNICLVSTTASGEWTPPLILSQKGESTINPQVVLNNQEEGMVIWRKSQGGLSTIQGVTLSAGLLWSSPIDLTTDSSRVGQAALSLNQQGSGILLWRQKEQERSLIQSEIFSFGSLAGLDATTDPLPVAPPEAANQTEMIEPIDPKGESHPIAPPKEIEGMDATAPIDPDKEAKPLPPPEMAESKETATLQVPAKESPPLPCFEPGSCCQRPYQWLFEIRGGAYRPTSSLLRRTFSEINADVGLLLGYSFCHRWSVVGSVDYVKRSRSSYNHLGEAMMKLVPLSVMLRYQYLRASWCSLYLGAGPRYFYLKSKNLLVAQRKTLTSEGIGVVGETGILFYISDYVTADLFVSYSYGTISGTSKAATRSRRSVDVGGLQAGVGVGVRF